MTWRHLGRILIYFEWQYVPPNRIVSSFLHVGRPEKLRKVQLCNYRHHCYQSQHPSIHLIFLTAYPLQSCAGMQPIPTVTGREAGYTVDKSPDYHRANTHRLVKSGQVNIQRAWGGCFCSLASTRWRNRSLWWIISPLSTNKFHHRQADENSLSLPC